MSAVLELRDAKKSFTMHLQGGLRLPVVAGVDFSVAAGQCVVLAGPSGAGKSSILKMIFGNYRCDSGHILVRHGGTTIDIQSNARGPEGDKGCTNPCKKIKMAAGAAGPRWAITGIRSGPVHL